MPFVEISFPSELQEEFQLTDVQVANLDNDCLSHIAIFLQPMTSILLIRRSSTWVAKLFGPQAIFRYLDEGAGHTT